MKRALFVMVMGLLAWCTSPAGASPIHTETGDAGQTIGTAQLADGGGTPGPITSIVGSLGNGNDVDIYKIYIANPASFSAFVQATADLPDPQLFLFRPDGTGVYANDDTSDLSALLPAGDPNSPTTAGYYYLAITSYDNDPQDSIPTLIFNSVPFTGVFGPTNPAAVLAGFSGGGYDDGGAYTIVLTGVTHLPEPLSVFVLGIAGLAGAGYAWRKRRTA